MIIMTYAFILRAMRIDVDEPFYWVGFTELLLEAFLLAIFLPSC